MSVASAESVPVEELYAAEYARAFDDFVRHLRGQGYPVSERLMEAAHERAAGRATDVAKVHGYRSMNFAPLAKAGLGRARAKHGY
jgi:hypothetical protein